MKINNLNSNPFQIGEDEWRRVKEVEGARTPTMETQLNKDSSNSQLKTTVKPKETPFHSMLVQDMRDLGMQEEEIEHVFKKKR